MNVVDGQTVNIGLASAVETVWEPHGTAGSEKWTTTNTSGNAADAIKLAASAGGITLDAGLDITLDPAGGDVYVKTASSVDPVIQFNSNSTDYWRMGVDTSDSNKFKIHGVTVSALVDNSVFEIGATEDAGDGITTSFGGLQFNTDEQYFSAQTGGRMIAGLLTRGFHVGPPVAFTSATGMAHGDEQTTYDAFAMRWKTATGGTYNGQHIAGGELDYKNNYVMIGTFIESTKYADEDTDFGLVAP